MDFYHHRSLDRRTMQYAAPPPCLRIRHNWLSENVLAPQPLTANAVPGHDHGLPGGLPSPAHPGLSCRRHNGTALISITLAVKMMVLDCIPSLLAYGRSSTYSSAQPVQTCLRCSCPSPWPSGKDAQMFKRKRNNDKFDNIYQSSSRIRFTASSPEELFTAISSGRPPRPGSSPFRNAMAP